MLKIGNITLPHGLMLGPMAGFSDYAMRRVCFAFGAEYAVTEMVSAKAVVYGDKKTHRLARIHPDEGAVAVQMFGSEPSVLAEAAGILAPGEPDGIPPVAIDINMGCPVPKVFGNGEGAALMRDPGKIYDIVRAVTSAISLPCTVKLRAGLDPSHRCAVECALAAEEGGAAWVALHGRTRREMYGGRADRAYIAEVRRRLHIPLVANGDISSGEDALAMRRITGADGLMVARAAVGNPFLFREILAAMDGMSCVPPTAQERRETALWQLDLAIADKGEAVAVREARGQIARYFSGLPGSAARRMLVHTAQTREDMLRAFDGWKE